MNYTCPVCGYDDLPESPEDYLICPSCGTEFGNDDTLFTYEELRSVWVQNGMNWFSHYTLPPDGWNPYTQLANLDSVQAREEVGFSITVVKLATTNQVVQYLTSNYIVGGHWELIQPSERMFVAGV
ncbi:MAG TPA: hypothetical protein VGC97_23840 [Pyrinomonadaceae bacterium]|jgi:hypothetical protein